MIAYIDSSVLLRKLFGEPAPLREWSKIADAFASRLLAVEVGRVIERCRLLGLIDDDDVVHLHTEARRAMGSIELLGLTDPILARAGGPMPTVVGTLDAIHLATALTLAPTLSSGLVMATHDEQLARAAQASGLAVCGV